MKKDLKLSNVELADKLEGPDGVVVIEVGENMEDRIYFQKFDQKDESDLIFYSKNNE